MNRLAALIKCKQRVANHMNHSLSKKKSASAFLFFIKKLSGGDSKLAIIYDRDSERQVAKVEYKWQLLQKKRMPPRVKCESIFRPTIIGHQMDNRAPGGGDIGCATHQDFFSPVRANWGIIQIKRELKHRSPVSMSSSSSFTLLFSLSAAIKTSSS